MSGEGSLRRVHVTRVFRSVTFAAGAALPIVAVPLVVTTRGADRVPSPAAHSERSPRSAHETSDAPGLPAARTTRLYRALCMPCHDADGTGDIGRETNPAIPDFTDARWQAACENSRLRDTILEGKGRAMPPFKTRLNARDANGLAALVRSFTAGRVTIPDLDDDPPAPPPSTPRSTAAGTASQRRVNVESPAVDAPALFRRLCQGCHGSQGRGEPLRGMLRNLPDFSAAGWKQRSKPGRIAATILEGRGTNMPAFRGRLNRAELDALITYITQLGPDGAPRDPAPVDAFERRLAELRSEFDALRRAYRELAPLPDQ